MHFTPSLDASMEHEGRPYPLRHLRGDTATGLRAGKRGHNWVYLGILYSRGGCAQILTRCPWHQRKP
jgi:hypothetical protein